MQRELKTMLDGEQASNPPGTKYIWLMYTGFLFIEPIFEPRPHLWLWTLVALGLFLPLYFWHFATCNRRFHLLIYFLIVLLGAATVPWNAGGMTFMVYAACFLPFIVRPVWLVLAGFLFQIAVVSAEAWLIRTPGFRLSWANVLINCFLMLVIGGSNVFFAQQKRADTKLRMKQEEIEALAAVAERERIARDLHDVLGHTLSLIVLKAELAGRLLESGTPDAAARARMEIGDVERTSRTALAEVREAIGGYRSRGLPAEVETARKTLAAAGVELHVDAADLSNAQLSAAEETVLALALREAVTNIVRHAQARTCRLRFLDDQGIYRLSVVDDGRNPVTREGNGLRGMRERVEALGGKLSLRSDNGTMLEVALPAQREPLTA